MRPRNRKVSSGPKARYDDLDEPEFADDSTLDVSGEVQNSTNEGNAASRFALPTCTHRHVAFFVANLVVTIIVAVVVSELFSSCNQSGTIDQANIERLIMTKMNASIRDEVTALLLEKVKTSMSSDIRDAVDSRLELLNLTSQSPTADVQSDDEVSGTPGDTNRGTKEGPTFENLTNLKTDILDKVKEIIENEKSKDPPVNPLPSDVFTRLWELEIQVKGQETKFEGWFTNLTAVNESLLGDISSLNSSTNESITHLETLHHNLTFWVSNLYVNVSELELWKAGLQANFESLVQDYTSFTSELKDQTLPEMEKETRTAHDRVKQTQMFAELVNSTVMGNLTKTKEKLEKSVQEKAGRLLKELDSLGMTVSYYNESNKEMKSNLSYYVFVTMILLVLVILAVLYIYGKMPDVIRGGQDLFYGHQKSYRASPLQRSAQGRPDYRRLRWNQPMENSVCVVVFHAQTERQHLDEAKSVFETVGQSLPKIRTSHVRSHEDIENLPGCKVFLIFVDFNERNIILEDPEKGLGDLRVTTVRSLWAFGADVTVIYCGDTGSRRLTSDLFNRELSSVFNHRELTQLNEQRRMLSVYEGFSEYQRTHVRNVINSFIPKR